MSSEIDIRIRNLSKVYRIYERPEDRLIQMATLGRVRRFTEFPALTGISFDIRRGETVGIVGRNGCGKSTLLQIICGTLQPSAGSVEVTGRISALLELGAGFNGEFTGRENVYMNGAILGFSRAEMDARFAAIADFAGIGDFIERPVKTYSSGMFVRLAFAVATAVEPDILVVDEALSVGDEAFQRKCFARIEAIKERGGTILFVSHSAQTIVQLCDRAILLDGGEKLMEGPPKQVVGQYQRLVNASDDSKHDLRAQIKALHDLVPSTPSAPSGETIVHESEIPSAPAADSADSSPKMAASQENVAEQLQSSSPKSLSDFFDPDLVTQSLMEHQERGARMRDVHLATLNGHRVNVLRLGKRYAIRFSVDFTEDFDEVDFGATIRLTTGLAAAGCMTNKVRGYATKGVRAGTRCSVEVQTNINVLPGKYFVSAAVFVRKGEDRFIAHRIVDALMFAVADDFDMIATGIVDAGMVVSVQTSLTPHE